MSLEDLILQAGGFEEGAFLNGVEVTRVDSLRDNAELATSIHGAIYVLYVDARLANLQLEKRG